MRDGFRAYYAPSAEEEANLWESAVIVLDTNALLNLFRYSEKTRDEWLELLEGEQDRLWSPHQVAQEFHRNRRQIAGQQEHDFAAVERALAKAEETIKGPIEDLKRNPTLVADELTALVERHMAKVHKKFAKTRARHFRAVLDGDAHEQTLAKISDLYEGRVGDPYTSEQLKDIHKEGGERYSKKIPPGYMDAPKEGNDKYGDLVLWKQVLDYGSQVKKPLIFVTGDRKEDWWLLAGGKSLGPRPELIAEYIEASGERAYFYQPRNFLRFAQESGEKISAAAIAESKKVSTVRDFKDINSALVRSLRDALGVQSAAALAVEGLRGVNISALDSIRSSIGSAGLSAMDESLRGLHGAGVESILGRDYWKDVGVASAVARMWEDDARHSALLRAAMEPSASARIAAESLVQQAQEAQRSGQAELEANDSSSPEDDDD
jgi:predicted nucleic acid-binding protein